MKVLILTVSTGYGHTSTAKALEDCLSARGAVVKTVDVYKYVNKFLSETLDKSTVLYAKYTPEVYRVIYEYLDSGNIDDRFNMVAFLNSLCSFKFEKLMREFCPDVVIGTHLLSVQLMHELKRKGKTQAAVIGICTDYTLHPYWETVSTVDYIVTASEHLTYRAVKKGIPLEKIQPLGIPVHPKFLTGMPKEEARRQLGCRPNSKIILMMGGGLGYGMFFDDADQIFRAERISRFKTEFELIVICGKNKKQYNQFIKYKQKIHADNISVYGFVDNIHVMMDAADILVSKPGGLSVTEALIKHVPMIAINPIAGHEERNLEFLLNLGLCIHASKTYTLDEAISLLLHNDNRLNSIRNNMIAAAKPNATEDIADLAFRLVQSQ